ncbi:MAG: hypothetical protein HFJ38_01760 [Bacilli bacterium]|nr:hypothetical protein [Bacilli bacterium]
MEFNEEKLIEKVQSLYENQLIDCNMYKRLNIAIYYFCHDVTIKQIEDMYEVSREVVRGVLHNPRISNYLGEEFYDLLQKKCKTRKREAYKRRNLLNLEILSEEELLTIQIVKRENVSITTKRELKMLRTAILYLANCSYSQISSILGYSKAAISGYLTDEHLKELLQDNYYRIILEQLSDRKPAASCSIVDKKERIIQFIQFIGESNLTLEVLKSMNVYALAKQFGIASSSMQYYLNDSYFEELLFRSCEEKVKRM